LSNIVNRLNYKLNHTNLLSPFRLIPVFILLVILLSGCNPTRYVPNDAYLLNKNKIEIDNSSISKKELTGAIRQKPNKRVIGLRFHLWVYNLSNIKKQKGLSAWLRKIGEEPVIFDQNQLQRSVINLKLYLKNKGYYQASVKDTLFVRKKKAEVVFQIKANKPYVLNKIKYTIHDTLLNTFIMPDTINSLIHSRNLFDADVMQGERVRLETLLKNRGYFSFTKEYIIFYADTTLPDNKVDLEIEIRNYISLTQDNFYSETPHPRYRIKDIYVYSEYDPQKNIANKASEDIIYQTAQFDSIHFIYSGRPYIKPKIINQSIYVQKDRYFNLDDVDKSYLHLSSLRTYKFIDIQFDDPNAGKYLPGADRVLDCRIRLTPLSKQSYSVNVEGTNSNGIFGVAGSLGYNHKNLFRGAEIFDLTLKGGVEGGKADVLKQIGSIIELGVTSNIRIPAFWLPFRTDQFIKTFSPKTNISISYDFQRRPYFTMTSASATFGYTWKGNENLTHIINPIELSAVKVFSIDTVNFPIVKYSYMWYSYQNHFVTVSNYSLIFNNQKVSKLLNYTFFRLNLESGGNILQGFSTAFNRPTVNGTYELFGLEYSQFVRADVEAKYYKVLNQTDKMVFRIFAGAGVPYGNSKAIPFEKQYFSGGFNGMRAWIPRGLGPGSYVSDPAIKYPNNTGDIKLEANIEYRFKLFWILEGALFADAGNIWAITKNDNRAGALFQWNKFANDIAVGTGFGLRFDFSFFIFSADLGFKTRDPSVTGIKWIPYQPFTKNAFALNVGIGYPF
jgi:outer membrane protein assembly factor BamA